MRLTLASGSPRRRDILRALGIEFDVEPSDADETLEPGEEAASASRRLARDKARAVAARDESPRAVLGADTVVVVDEAVLGKPRTDEEAQAMIARLAGRWHRVITGVALVVDRDAVEDLAVETRVRFVPMNAARIRRYVATGEGRDKAGAYAVQGIGGGLVDRIEGSYSNVVGLPAAETVALLERHRVLEDWP